MGTACDRCGKETNAARFCPSCGTERVAPRAPIDPFIGETINGRYKIVELISSGGMGRVYRAKQALLEREVAVKVIHPHLSASETVVARFLAEARMSSRLNHPNIVSVYDFGQTSEREGAHLFLVMELLSGRSLASMLASGEPMPARVIARIMRQILAALAEAHAVGITHRDVKPENILIEQRRGESMHVKVIDFGIATSAENRRVSIAGQLLGTPHYIAPETLAGRPGPSVDLYAAGILFFEMLAGVVPFDGNTLIAILTRHTTAPRPDPRDLAPGRAISEAMARVAIRAIQIDPGARFESAEEFAAAIDGAAEMYPAETTRAPVARIVVRPLSDPTPQRPVAETLSDVLAPDDAASPGPHATSVLRDEKTPRPASASRYSQEQQRSATVQFATLPPRPKPPGVTPPSPEAPESVDAIAVVTPDQFVSTAWQQIERQCDDAHVFWGRTGIGKSTILDRVVAQARRKGMIVIRASAPSPPRDEVGYTSLRGIISALLGVATTDPSLCSGEIAGDERLATQLQRVFGPPHGPAADTGALGGRESSDALRWAGRRAIERVRGKRVLLAIDDIDGFDGASRWAIEELLDGTPVPGLTIVMTSELPPASGIDRGIVATRVPGLSRAAGRILLGEAVALARTDDDIEPLYLQHLRQWPEGFGAPQTLSELLEWQIRALPAAQRPILQVLSVLGGCTRAELKTAAPQLRDDDDARIAELASAGFVRVDGAWIYPAHSMYLRVALETTPAALMWEIRRRATAGLAGRDGEIELRAFHAIRAATDEASLDLVARAAEVRAARGDHASVAALLPTLDGARKHLRQGEGESIRAEWTLVAQVLGASLVAIDRLAEAASLLLETLEITGLPDASRALILKQLETIEEGRGRPEEAERWRREALTAAERCGDSAVLAQVETTATRMVTGPHRKLVFTSSQSVRPVAMSDRSGS